MAIERFPATQQLLETHPLGERLAAFAHQLRCLSGRDLDVRFHRNRWVYLSWCPVEQDHRLVVRLHEAFLDAPSPVLDALGKLISCDDREARRIVNAFVDAQSPLWDLRSARPPRPLRINPRGQVYDLQAIFDELNRRYFGGQCAARITWGNGARVRRRRRQVTLGSYEEVANLIRVHPMLDRRKVPKYYVRYIVFHEMLHATLPATMSPAGRTVFHSRLFCQRERLFEDFPRAQQWGKRYT